MLILQTGPFFLAAIFCSILIPVIFHPYIGKFNAGVWAAFLFHATAFTFMPFFPNAAGEVYVQLGRGFQYTRIQGLQFLVLLYALPMTVIFLAPLRRYLWRFLVALMAADLIYLTYNLLTGKNKGFMDVYSFDAAIAFTVAIYCLSEANAKKFWRGLGLTMTLSAFCMSGDTTILAVIFAGLALAVYYFEKTKKVQRAAWVGGIILAGLGLVGLLGVKYFVMHETFDGTRVDIWTQKLSGHFESVPKFVLGLGPSSFSWIGLEPVNGQQYSLMHSDLLQVFFEFGFFYAVLFLVFYLVNLWRLRTHATFFAMAGAYLAAVLVYYPTHYFFSLLIGLGLLAEVTYLQRPESYDEAGTPS